MKKAIIVLSLLGFVLGILHAAPTTHSDEVNFDWAALFVIEGGMDDVEADDDWLLENDCDGGYVYDTQATLVFSWDEVDNDFVCQFRINDANGDDWWSDEFYFDSTDDYMIQKWEFDVDYTGVYDFYVYVNGYEWYHGTFDSK